MRRHRARETGEQRVIEGMSARHNKGGPQVVPEPSTSQEAPEQDVVASMVGHSLGPILDDLADAKDGIRKAQQFRKAAKSVGAKEVEAMIEGELRGLETAARIGV